MSLNPPFLRFFRPIFLLGLAFFLLSPACDFPLFDPTGFRCSAASDCLNGYACQASICVLALEELTNEVSQEKASEGDPDASAETTNDGAPDTSAEAAKESSTEADAGSERKPEAEAPLETAAEALTESKP